jgi:hypothetical protein
MLTSALVTALKKEFPDWSRTEILDMINEVQKIVFTQRPTAQMRIYNNALSSSTLGLDPTLNTTAGVYEYQINSSTCTMSSGTRAWRVVSVYKDDEEEQEEITTFDGSANDDSLCAKVIFDSDPGTTTNTYHIRCYKYPTEITVESIRTIIPEQFHRSHLYEGVAGFIEKFRSGKSDRWDIFFKILLKEILQQMSEGRRRSTDVPYRNCGE